MKFLEKLFKPEPVDVKPGFNAIGRFGTIHLKVQVYRADEGRWYEIDEVKSK